MDSHNANATGAAARKMAAAEPLSPAPNSQRGTNMKIAPRNRAAALTAVATEFIVEHLLPRHDVRQRRGQSGGDEPRESVDDQRAEQDPPRARAELEQQSPPRA